MIYKVYVGDQTYMEAEYCFGDKQINIHMAQGHQVGCEIDYTNFFNFSLDENECKELIKSLQLSLADLISYEQIKEQL